jgi:ABC-2 type transport system ATP-binding protein
MVFDEPTNGLDPTGITEVWSLIKKIAKEGKTIIMASHMLDEVEKVCTHAAILKKGALLTSRHVDEIRQMMILLNLWQIIQLLLLALKTMPGNRGMFEQEGGEATIHFAQGEVNLSQVNKHCFEMGYHLTIYC